MRESCKSGLWGRRRATAASTRPLGTQRDQPKLTLCGPSSPTPERTERAGSRMAAFELQVHEADIVGNSEFITCPIFISVMAKAHKYRCQSSMRMHARYRIALDMK